MKINKVDFSDDFGDSWVFWIIVKDVDNKYQEIAREIDKENYSKDCFGICLGYDYKDFYIIKDDGKQLYYIDNIGNKHWFECEINEKLFNDMTEMVKNNFKLSKGEY